MQLHIYLQGYTARVSHGMSPTTRLSLVQALQRLSDFFGDRDVEDLTKSDMAQFGAWLQANFSPQTAKQTISLANRAMVGFWTLRASDIECLILNASMPELRALVVLMATSAVCSRVRRRVLPPTRHPWRPSNVHLSEHRF